MRWETDGKRRRRCEEGSGEVRSTVEMLLADWEEVAGAGGRTGAQSPSRGELLSDLSCDFHWYRQISPRNAGRKDSLTSITAVLSLPGFAAARGVHFGDRCV